MHELPKYVLFRGEEVASWHNSHHLGAYPATAIEDLKHTSHDDIAVFAGAQAVTSALAMGVVDELRLVVHPHLIAGGTRLFDPTGRSGPLHLTDSRRLDSGVVVLRYDLTA